MTESCRGQQCPNCEHKQLSWEFIENASPGPDKADKADFVLRCDACKKVIRQATGVQVARFLTRYMR